MRHAHRKCIQYQAFAIEPLAQLPQQGEAAALQAAVVAWLGNRHQAAQAQPGQCRDSVRQGRQIIWRAAALGGFCGNIHLDAYLKCRQFLRALGCQAFGNFQAIHRMHPGEVLRYLPCLVALQRPDEMPLEAGVGQFRCLVAGFLHIVLAERTLSDRGCLAHAGRRPGLGNGQQLHGFRLAPGGNAGSGDACTHSLQVGGD